MPFKKATGITFDGVSGSHSDQRDCHLTSMSVSARMMLALSLNQESGTVWLLTCTVVSQAPLNKLSTALTIRVLAFMKVSKVPFSTACRVSYPNTLRCCPSR